MARNFRLQPKEIRKKFEKELYGKKENIEGILLFRIGSLAAFVKRRGTSIGEISKSGEYLSYENLKEGVKGIIKDFLKKYPKLKYSSYVLPLLAKLKDPYVGKVLEILAEEYEIYKKFGFNYLPRKSLKT